MIPQWSVCSRHFFEEHTLEVTEAVQMVHLEGVTSMHHLRVQGLAHTPHKLRAKTCAASSFEFVDANEVSFSWSLCEELDVVLRSPQATLEIDNGTIKTLNASTDHVPFASARVHNSCIKTATISGFPVFYLDGGLLEELHFTGGDLKLYTNAYVQQVECIPDLLSPRLNLDLAGGYAGTVRIAVNANLDLLIQVGARDQRHLESLVFLGDGKSSVTLNTKVKDTRPPTARQVTFRRVVFTNVATAHLTDSLTLEVLALNDSRLDLSLSTITITQEAIIPPGARISGGTVIISEDAGVVVAGGLDDVHLDVNGLLVITGTLRDCNISVGPFGRVAIEDTATLDRVEFL